MQATIRGMEEKDRSKVIEMMTAFYSSPAVWSNGSKEIFEADVDACVGDNPYFEGYIFESPDGIKGYAMVAKSFSAEFGKSCIWIEDLFVQDGYRGMGIGSMFLKFIESKYPDSIFRLEVEDENKPAVALYKKCGFEVIPYMEMKK